MIGRVLARQSSFWDLVTPTGGVRIHFLGKKEYRFVEAEFDGFAFHSEHPVLIQYQEEWRALYIGSRAPDPSDILEKASKLLLKVVAPWRTAGEYLNIGFDPLAILSSGSGLLLRGPRSLVQPIEDLLESEGISFSSIAEHVRQEPLKVLTAGRNFVVARDFRTEALLQGTTSDSVAGFEVERPGARCSDSKPVWIMFPKIPWGSIGWRMGAGEDYWHSWMSWFRAQPASERATYHVSWPEPEGWQGFYDFIDTGKAPAWFFQQQRLMAEAAQPPTADEQTIDRYYRVLWLIQEHMNCIGVDRKRGDESLPELYSSPDGSTWRLSASATRGGLHLRRVGGEAA